MSTGEAGNGPAALNSSVCTDPPLVSAVVTSWSEEEGSTVNWMSARSRGKPVVIAGPSAAMAITAGVTDVSTLTKKLQPEIRPEPALTSSYRRAGLSSYCHR